MKTRYQQYMALNKSIVPTPVGYLTVFASDTGIKAIDFADTHPEPSQNEVSALAALQLQQYIEGARQHFELPLDAEGTDFQISVWHALLDVKYGEISTYLSIAKKVGNPLASRAIGMANGKNPIPIIVPCHRIVGSNGKLTGYAGGLHRKTYLLDLEAKYS